MLSAHGFSPRASRISALVPFQSGTRPARRSSRCAGPDSGGTPRAKRALNVAVKRSDKLERQSWRDESEKRTFLVEICSDLGTGSPLDERRRSTSSVRSTSPGSMAHLLNRLEDVFNL